MFCLCVIYRLNNYIFHSSKQITISYLKKTMSTPCENVKQYCNTTVSNYEYKDPMRLIDMALCVGEQTASLSGKESQDCKRSFVNAVHHSLEYHLPPSHSTSSNQHTIHQQPIHSSITHPITHPIINTQQAHISIHQDEIRNETLSTLHTLKTLFPSCT